MARGSLRTKDRPIGDDGSEVVVTRMKVRGLLFLLAVLVCLPWGASLAGEPPRAKVSVPGPGDCAREVWRNATDNPWFYNEAGDLVVPKVNYQWLVVRFHEDPTAGEVTAGELPPAILKVSTLFKEQLVDLIHDPGLDPNLCMYRLRNPENSSLVAAEIGRSGAGGLVRSVRPAYVIGDTNFALLDEIEIHWKTQVNEQQKAALLKKAGVIPLAGDAGGKQRVRIDPCQASVWETANLIHEDLHVVSASPVLTKIEPPVRATFTVGLNGTTIGAPLPFSLEILFAKRIRIEPATIANLNLCPQELSRHLFKVEYDRPLSSVDVTASPIRVHGRLYLYGTGEFTLPEVPVYYRQVAADETELVMIRTPQVPVRIASVIPEAPGRYQLKVAEVQELPAIRVADLKGRKILALSIAALGAAVFLLCLVGFRRMAIPGATALPAARVPVDVGKYESVLREALSADRASFGSAEIAAFGHAFRGYLGARCGVSAESMGGGAEVFFATLRDRLPAEIRPRVYETLELLETGLSRGQLRQGEIERIFASARVVLQHYESHVAK
jgi:hypothetical protein